MAAKKRALISVSDKRFLTNFARELVKYNYEILASGGTYEKLKEAAIPAKNLARAIASPEILGGRVKTLHPAVHAGLLADRDDPVHMKELAKQAIIPIDMLVVNFYPFMEKVQPGKTNLAGATELIDIGGPTMVRAAAKNHKHVIVVSSIEQYREVLAELKSGDVSQAMRLKLAGEAFRTTAANEAAIAAFFANLMPKETQTTSEAVVAEQRASAPASIDSLPSRITLALREAEPLRYGENPHQKGARYTVSGIATVPFRFIQGKEMSYNNYLDAAAALSIVSGSYSAPVVACVVKHHNPCGIAIGNDPVKTFNAAYSADEESAFGGIVGLNVTVDGKLAEELRRYFFEIIVAPDFSDDAREKLSQKKNLRLIQASPEDCRTVQATSARANINLFGVLMQGYDVVNETWEQLNVVSSTPPPEKLQADILTGLQYIRYLKSNSICLVKDGVMVGAGLGQMSRVAATRIALESAARRANGAVLISDAFFPFPDSLELAAKAKVGCVVAPAGSKRDMEVVGAANTLKLPLVFAPYRHFLH